MLNYFLAFILCVDIIFAQHKVDKRALQGSHEKSKIEKWSDYFLNKPKIFDQNSSLINLINEIVDRYLFDCSLVVLYDEYFEENDRILLKNFFKSTSNILLHGSLSKTNENFFVKLQKNTCFNYLLFVSDVVNYNFSGINNSNKIIIITKSSQWKINEFLTSETAQNFINLLIVSPSQRKTNYEVPYVLYTHELYIDGLGSSKPIVLTSWRAGKLTRPKVNLFPKKIKDGFSGHRFFISLAEQPPYVIKKGLDENDDIKWDGVEIRLIKLLAEVYNFTTDFRPIKDLKSVSSGDVVSNIIRKGQATVGISGLYITSERSDVLDISQPHSFDCASFISLTSTALARYRAIMGPFNWSVWLALTVTYLVAIFPLAFSYKHTLRHLIETPKDLENMFWYVFGTFTNCFTFGKESWTNSQKVTTRILMVFYWIFTIIITSCYTGSIIAFITLPIYPSTVDTAKQLLYGHYQIGTLNKGGWEYWFANSSDPITKKLLKNIEFLPNIEAGLKNITRTFFWPYAFLGSKAQLDYIVKTNFTTTNKRSLMHISSECFVPYGIGLAFTKKSIYKNVIDDGILRIIQSGFMLKFQNDVEWDVMRSATGKLLQVNSKSKLKYSPVEDRALTLDDTQGMFLLLGAGFLMGICSLISEYLSGCSIISKKRVRTTINTSSKSKSFTTPTSRDKLGSPTYDVTYKFDDVFNDKEYENCHNLTKLTVDSEKSQRKEVDFENKINERLVFNDNEDENCHNLTKLRVDSEKSQRKEMDFENKINERFNFDELFGEPNHNSQFFDEDLDFQD